MFCKFVFVAFLFVSLTQVQGNELEEAIKNGLTEVKGLYESGQNKVNSSIVAVGYKREAIERKISELVMKLVVEQQGVTQAIRNSAKAMEEKAKEQNKPESVFECIKEAEENVNNQIQTLLSGIKLGMKNETEEIRNAIENISEPLYGMLDALKAECEEVVKTIRACETTDCVDNAVAGCAKWLEQMNAEIDEVLYKVHGFVNKREIFVWMASNIWSWRTDKVKSRGIKDIEKCVFG